MSFRVRLYCKDCTGQDELGCFDGGTQLLTGDGLNADVLEFDAAAEASEAGWKETANCGPWAFEVLDDQDVVVFDSDRG